MKTIKNELKEMAKKIRELKKEISSGMRNGIRTGSEQYELIQLKSDFRYKHIAYCIIFRGKNYEQIEPKIRKGNEINYSKLDTLMDEYTIIFDSRKEANNA